MEKKERVLVAMSGGVDSSAAVKVLLSQGYEVAGATMHLYSNEDIEVRSKTCCSLSDVEDARLAALRLGIDFHVFNFSEEFGRRVIDNFIETYLAGGTPNPCIECNKHLKFGSFYERARLLGFDKIATGHYAVIERRADGRYLLKRSPDRAKDQSYVLYSMTQDQLAHTLFPVGTLDKSETRRIAGESGLANADKPESQDICFVPDGRYADLIVNRAGQQPEGNITLTDGTVIGRHNGLINYTVGQRKGVRVSYSEPLFVCEKNVQKNSLIMATAAQMRFLSLTAKDVNFIPFDELAEPLRCTAQTRYHQKDMPCTVYPPENGEIRVVFDEPQRAVSAGQAVVLYDGDYVLGGGTISSAERKGA